MTSIETKHIQSDYDQIIKHYNSAWATTDEKITEVPPLVGKLKELLPLEKKVLDLGSGPGRLSIPLAAGGFEVTAIDASSVAIDQLSSLAKKQSLIVKAFIGDIRKFPDLDEQYNGIVALFVLHHLNCVEAEKLMNNMRETTLPGGVNVIRTFSTEGDVYRADPSTMNYFPRNQDGLLNSYIQSGWSILSYNEIIAPMPGNRGNNQVLCGIMRKPN